MPRYTPARQTRLDAARQWAGYRNAGYARETGTLVVVVNSAEAGLDGKWSTICDDHDWVICHETLSQAIYHAPNPLGWCERCSGSEPLADEDED